MLAIHLEAFKEKVEVNKKRFRNYLTRLENNPPATLDITSIEIDKAVWPEIDCLSCANCCKTMTPTFTNTDIKRIATHLKMKPKEFKEKWLYQDKTGDWMNTTQPCQFLDLTTNMCSIYEVRPDDCAGFPHLKKAKMTDYLHVHKQNVQYCPATYKMVEKMMEAGIKPIS